jgi:hypothetical protein
LSDRQARHESEDLWVGGAAEPLKNLWKYALNRRKKEISYQLIVIAITGDMRIFTSED